MKFIETVAYELRDVNTSNLKDNSKKKIIIGILNDDEDLNQSEKFSKIINAFNRYWGLHSQKNYMDIRQKLKSLRYIRAKEPENWSKIFFSPTQPENEKSNLIIKLKLVEIMRLLWCYYKPFFKN